jgi:5,10-methylenetetrahydrofolate reductase
MIEVDPPTRPEMWRVDMALAATASACDGFVIPDNHLGRATISSVAVASRVAVLGKRAIACLNARDRNVLGLRRDLLTAAAFGVREFLLVYGDDPEVGSRTLDLNSRRMFAEARAFASEPRFGGLGPFRFGAVCRVGGSIGWRAEADFLFVQMTHDLDGLVTWASGFDFSGAVFPGVMVLSSRAMAERLMARIPGFFVAADVLDALDTDGGFGVELALRQLESIRATGVFAGAHLIPGVRHEAVAHALADRRTATAKGGAPRKTGLLQ